MNLFFHWLAIISACGSTSIRALMSARSEDKIGGFHRDRNRTIPNQSQAELERLTQVGSGSGVFDAPAVRGLICFLCIIEGRVEISAWVQFRPVGFRLSPRLLISHESICSWILGRFLP